MKYRLTPENKKCTIEKTIFSKGNKQIVVETVWRFAVFDLEYDEVPTFEPNMELYEQFGNNLEFVESGDGDVFYDYKNMTEEEIVEAQNLIDEEGMYALEELGYTFDDTMWYFDCDVEIEEIV